MRCTLRIDNLTCNNKFVSLVKCLLIDVLTISPPLYSLKVENGEGAIRKRKR